jgi:DNA-binding winged helix-turn-helix (wHTH) protein/tetratricopeptide (TPR) repeat protein
VTAGVHSPRSARFGPFKVDVTTGELQKNNRKIKLQNQPFQILILLLERAGDMVTRDEIRAKVWSTDTIVEFEHGIATAVKKLRQALDDDAHQPRYIETLSRRGYRWLEPVSWNEANATTMPPAVVTRKASGGLVGRDGSLATLRESFARARHGERQIVHITGDAGIGKTALVDEFQQEASLGAPDLLLGRGQCIDKYGDVEPYYPVLEALSELLRATARNSVIAALSLHAPTWLAQFPALLTPDRRGTLEREILGMTRDRMLREICDALETMSTGQPVMLVLEDLQWADPSTVDFISAVGRRRAYAQLILLTTHRPVAAAHRLNQVKQDLLAQRLCREIALEPLSESDVFRYLFGESPKTPSTVPFSRLIHRRSEGNPLFIVAALDNMTRKGLIARKDTAIQLLVTLEELDIGVPNSLAKMIEAQIERLSAEERGALEVGSIVGVTFSTSLIGAAMGVAAQHVEQICDSIAKRHQLVRPAGFQQYPDGSVSRRYQFVHALYRDVMYEGQPSHSRMKWHGRIGEQLEQLVAHSGGSEHLTEVAPDLAHHFEAAADWGRAAKYLEMTAETACRSAITAPLGACLILERALDLVQRVPDAARAEIELSILQRLAAMYVSSFAARAVDTYETLASRAASYGLINAEISGLIGMAYPASFVSSQRCLQAVERALTLSDRLSDPLLRARARASCLVRRIWARGWNAEDAGDCVSALAEIRLSADRYVVAAHLVDCNLIAWASSNYRVARQDAVWNLRILSEKSEDNAYVNVAYWMSQFIMPWSLLFLGEWGELLRELDSGIAILARNGDHYRAQTLCLYSAWLHFYAMDFDQVVKICKSILPLVDLAERTPWRRFCLVLAGSAEAALGRETRALDRLLKVTEEMDRQTVIHDWYTRMLLESALTELWVAHGDIAQARVQADRFLKRTLATAEHTWQALAWETSARLAISDLDLERAQECVAQALESMEGFETPLAEWRVHATAADLAQRTGDAERATQHLKISGATILRLANSLPANHRLRATFLSATPVSRVLSHPQAS